MTMKSRVLTTNFKMFVQQHTGQQVISDDTLCRVQTTELNTFLRLFNFN